MPSDPPLHVALSPDLRRLPVRLVSATRSVPCGVAAALK